MYLIERHKIKPNHKYYKEIDHLSFLSKNLFNMSLYNIRQHYFNTKTYLSLKDNYNKLKNIQKKDYESLPRKVSNQVIKQVDRSFKSFFNALKEYKKNPNKFKSCPKITRYKDKLKGRNIIIYEKGAISKKGFKNGLLHLSQTNIYISTKLTYDIIKEVRISKIINGYNIDIVYYKEGKELKSNNKYASIDLGVNNLMTLTFNDYKSPLIFNGRPLKSINQYYNKELSRLKSELKLRNKRHKSKRINKLNDKRNNKIDDYLHKMSRMLVNQLVSNDISKLIIGKNINWKQDINIGKQNNQNFVQIPFNKLIDMLNYKCLLEGIECRIVNESYTSKCSFLDNEDVKKHNNYKGKRIKRGLFKTNKGYLINSDVNGSYNIMKKAFPNLFDNDGIEGLSVVPLKLNVL